MRMEFIKNIGGQNHVHCQKHKLPLIRSNERERKCQCGRNEYYRCCNFHCKVNICRSCFTGYNSHEITYVAELEESVQEVDYNDESSTESLLTHYRYVETDEIESEIDCNECQKEREEEEELMRLLNPSNLDDLSIDDSDDFVTSTFANDLNTEG